jgi:hypothetical protein
MPGFSLPDGESQGENRDRTGIVADYAFAVSHLLTRAGPFSEGWQGNFDDGLTPKSGNGEYRKTQFTGEKNDHMGQHQRALVIRVGLRNLSVFDDFVNIAILRPKGRAALMLRHLG